MPQLILLYGPPASGKLTIARLVAKKTGYCLFDNTLTVNLAKRLFKFGSKQFVDLCQDLRIFIFQRVVTGKLHGLIFTFCYSNPRDNHFIENVEAIMKAGAWKIIYVYLHADQAILEQRVTSNERTALSKIDSIPTLRENLKRSNYVLISGRPSISIDTGIVDSNRANKIILAEINKMI